MAADPSEFRRQASVESFPSPASRTLPAMLRECEKSRNAPFDGTGQPKIA